MSAENLSGIDIGCAQLVEEDVGVLNESIVARLEGVKSLNELEDWDFAKDIIGVCVTGQRGQCPKRHNCGEVKIKTVVLPLFIEVEPIELKND
jgi:hypothetical protein